MDTGLLMALTPSYDLERTAGRAIILQYLPIPISVREFSLPANVLEVNSP